MWAAPAGKMISLRQAAGVHGSAVRSLQAAYGTDYHLTAPLNRAWRLTIEPQSVLQNLTERHRKENNRRQSSIERSNSLLESCGKAEKNSKGERTVSYWPARAVAGDPDATAFQRSPMDLSCAAPTTPFHCR